MENNKLANTACVIDRLLKVVQGVLIACMIICAVFIPLTAIFGEKVVADASTLDLGFVKLELAGGMMDYLDGGKLKLCIILTMVSTIIALAAGWYCLRVLRSILEPMKEGQPFASGISGKVRRLAWTVLIGGALVELGRLAAELFTVRAYRLEELFNSPAVKAVSVNGSIRHWFIFAALILFFLSFVFRYGEELQRESDETL